MAVGPLSIVSGFFISMKKSSPGGFYPPRLYRLFVSPIQDFSMVRFWRSAHPGVRLTPLRSSPPPALARLTTAPVVDAASLPAHNCLQHKTMPAEPPIPAAPIPCPPAGVPPPPPAEPASTPSAGREFLAVLLSLYLGLFVADATISLADATWTA